MSVSALPPSPHVRPAYPTGAHAEAAEAIAAFFEPMPEIEAVLLVNSCARGKATPDSCLDINALARPDLLSAHGERLNREWEAFYAADPVFEQLRSAGAYSEVHLDIIDGQFTPGQQDEMGPPDYFEVMVGNALVYSHPLWQRGDFLDSLKAKWLPYYGDDLRHERLKSVRWFCLNQLHHVPLYAARGLYFQAFDRLYFGLQDFLQAVFIARRVYPIAYNKWIREQFVDVLGLPELYARLPGLLEVAPFESMEVVEKAKAVEALLDEYAPGESA
jgi:hypothetical protein